MLIHVFKTSHYFKVDTVMMSNYFELCEQEIAFKTWIRAWFATGQFRHWFDVYRVPKVADFNPELITRKLTTTYL